MAPPTPHYYLAGALLATTRVKRQAQVEPFAAARYLKAEFESCWIEPLLHLEVRAAWHDDLSAMLLDADPSVNRNS